MSKIWGKRPPVIRRLAMSLLPERGEKSFRDTALPSCKLSWRPLGCTIAEVFDSKQKYILRLRLSYNNIIVIINGLSLWLSVIIINSVNKVTLLLKCYRCTVLCRISQNLSSVQLHLFSLYKDGAIMKEYANILFWVLGALLPDPQCETQLNLSRLRNFCYTWWWWWWQPY